MLIYQLACGRSFAVTALLSYRVGQDMPEAAR
jgi:hypothetical protein